ncbi:MAG: 3-dehydroquinate synthase [bacterium]
MSKAVHVKLGSRSYDINIGRNLAVGASIARRPGLKAMIVSDTNVDPLYGARCGKALQARGVEITRVVVRAGEAAKCARMAEKLYDKAAELRLDRSSYVIALGGGVVGDLAGFVAATYLRGIRFVQVPTTMLAMVDSSVGGKTGINLRQGKNLVGAFHQPVEVDADLATLETLPEREYVSGLAEVVKYGVICDAAFFRMLEKNVDGLMDRDPRLLEDVVARCCAIKASVVRSDEREEKGARAVLNFGHTFGHALERTAGYGAMLHGEAVSVGMAFAAILSMKDKGLPHEESYRIMILLKRLGLPVSAPGMRRKWRALRSCMAADKKTVAGGLRFVLVERIGSAIIGCSVPESRLEEAFAEVSWPE